VAGRLQPEKRRRFALVGLVALGLVLLVLVPGYIATRPGYFSHFETLEAKYEPWSESTHVKASCQDCHVSPKALPQAAFDLRMVGEFYYSLVARSHTPDVFGTPTNAACLSCHEDLRTVSPEGDLRIPHKAHVNILKMPCVRCHDYLVHENNPQGTNTPTMAGCLECHNGDTAKNTCSACHTEKAAPSTHTAANWLVEHPNEVSAECDECHAWTANWCADCHSRRPRSHTVNWRKIHGEQVAKNRNCEACHTAEFCIRCHGQLPKLNYDPSLELVK
jgi:hypothetical protein